MIQTLPPDLQEGAQPPSSDSSAPGPLRTFRRQSSFFYCLVLLLAPLLAIPASILLGASDFFLHHGASVWVQANDQVFAMQNRSCDVVVFGDSTAMTGIDPAIVQARTGLHTCNISVTNAVLTVTGNLTLDHFLTHNTKPRVLLIQLSPDDFQPASRSWRQTIYPEGLLELLRHGSPAEARRVLLTHPQEAIAFGGYAVGYTAWYGLKSAWFRATGMRPAEDTVTVRNGFFTPPAPARSRCDLTGFSLPVNARDTAYSHAVVEQYRQTFASRAGTVLVDVAPIPSCERDLPAYAAELNGVTSNCLLPLPIGLFNDERHYTASGSQAVSTMIATQLGISATERPLAALPPAAVPHLASLIRHGRSHRGLRHGTSVRSGPGDSTSTEAPASNEALLGGTPTLPAGR